MAMQSQPSHLTSLSLGFLIYKIGTTIQPLCGFMNSLSKSSEQILVSLQVESKSRKGGREQIAFPNHHGYLMEEGKAEDH